MKLLEKLKNIKGIVIVLALAVSPIIVISKPVSAAGDCAGVQTFFDWGCGSDEGQIITDVLVKVLNWAAIGVTVAVVIGILYGAIMIGSAGGNEAQMKKGLGIIKNAAIALVLYFLMYSLLNFIIPGGLFT
ncbi:MAG: hypothetical protein Q4C83_00130 [Candidatus Saccharibacteria bacterium]|nr:hypothetical protein [Candidatus Saccharibacteria bacterium]